jgi:TRAP-type C4-dicarboxylate transport system permease small subunit
VVNQLIAGIHRLEEALLVLLLTSMIGVAAAQVVMRNFFDSGLFWGDSAVRVAVLWVAMLGAMVASRNDGHIRIDIAGRYLPDGIKKSVGRMVSLFTCIVLALFAWYSYDFVRFEYEDATLAFGVVPAWICEAIMPVGAGVMALRFALLFIKPVESPP